MAEKSDPPSFRVVDGGKGGPPIGPATHFSHALEYLAARGIKTPEIIDKLGMKIMPAATWFAETYNSRSNDERIAIKFTHYDLNGKEIEWHSVKFVKPRKQTSGITFSSVVQDTRPTRSSPKGQMIHGYLCPLNNWRNLKKGQRIFVCESVIKAANVSMLGLPAVGLNGVAAFSSTKKNVDLISELKELPWEKLQLQPVILYDSDYEKYDITRAYETLANKLSIICHSPPPIYLPLPPPNETEHWGFDDARAEFGDEWAKDFLAGDGFPITLDDVRQAMHDLNERVAVVENISKVVELDTGTLMSQAEFKGLNYANWVKFSVEGKPISIAKAWMDWKDRNSVRAMDYLPGQDVVADGKYNTWKGMGHEPKEGEVMPWIDLLSNNIRDDRVRKYLIQWCAWTVQNLGKTSVVTPVLVGVQGTGKSLFALTLGAVHGPKNFKAIELPLFLNSFNEVWARSTLVAIEEAYSDIKTSRSFMSRFKMYSTSDRITVNAKHTKEYDIKNCINWLITTNHADAIPFEGNDRRFMVAHFDPVRFYPGGHPHWNKYGDWLAGSGPAALHHYLLNVDMEGFDPYAPAIETSYKQVMEEAAMSGPELFVKDLYEDPDKVWPGKCALVTAKELAQVFFEGEVRDITSAARAMSKCMANRGFKQANDGKPIRWGNKMERYWIIREKDKYEHAEVPECKAHLDQFKTEKDTSGNKF